MISRKFAAKIEHIDISNKVYNEDFELKIYFCGIRIFKKTYERRESYQPKDKIGFNK